MTALPAGWVTTTLGDLALEVRNGISAKPDQDAGLPILRISAVRPMKLDASDVRYLPAEFRDANNYALRADDLLFTRYNGNRELVGACARVHAVSGTLTYPDKLIRVRLDTRAAMPAFIEAAACAQGARNFIDQQLKTSAGQVGVSGADLKRLPLPLAPLPEQQRITTKLDAVVARVDACRDRLVRVTPLLKRFRQSVLAAATSGGLTEEWRELHGQLGGGHSLLAELQADHTATGGHARGNASEPTEEAHDLDDAALPTPWAIATMLDLCEPGRPITYGILKPGPVLDEGIPYIRVADFPGNRLRIESIKKTSPEIDEQFKRARLRPGDLLLSIRGSVGRVIEIPAVLANANITQDTARLSISARVSRRYVLLALLDEGTQRRMRAATRGVAVRGINIGDVRALQIPLPPPAEQAEIVRRVEILFAFADRLEARLAKAQAAADRLTPALLAKAFRGELVPQDPIDEPAAVLLQRLATSRPAPATKTRWPRADQAG